MICGPYCVEFPALATIKSCYIIVLYIVKFLIGTIIYGEERKSGEIPWVSLEIYHCYIDKLFVINRYKTCQEKKPAEYVVLETTRNGLGVHQVCIPETVSGLYIVIDE